MLRSYLVLSLLTAVSFITVSSAFAQVAGLPGATLQQEIQRNTQPEVYAPWAFQAQSKLKAEPREPIQIIREKTGAEISPKQETEPVQDLPEVQSNPIRFVPNSR